MINQLIEISNRVREEFGVNARDEMLEQVGREIDVSPHSLKTNYLTKRSYNQWKLPRAVKKANEVYKLFKSTIGGKAEEKTEPSKVDAEA